VVYTYPYTADTDPSNAWLATTLLLLRHGVCAHLDVRAYTAGSSRETSFSSSTEPGRLYSCVKTS